eukprot:73667-Amphidinium_carterae.1
MHVGLRQHLGTLHPQTMAEELVLSISPHGAQPTQLEKQVQELCARLLVHLNALLSPGVSHEEVVVCSGQFGVGGLAKAKTRHVS